MKQLLTFLILLCFNLFATAYESDTHFDMMYHLSRASGFSDGTAKFLALANQHIDEVHISSPLLLAAQRQLFHFPGDIEKIDIEGHGAISIPSILFKSKLALAERNSALGNYLIYLGLSRGDLMLTGLGMHVKMDTYGHAGFANITGHLTDGHNPDRAFLEARKYEDMVRSMVQALVAVRKLLPVQALDKESALKYLNKSALKTHLNRQLTVQDLDNATVISGVIMADDEMLGIYREDIFKKFEYKKFALSRIYEKFKNTGEINKDIKFEELFPDELLQDRRMDSKDVIKHVIITTADAEFLKARGGKEIFNLKKLFGFKSEDTFYRKFQIEVGRAEFRLRELFHLEKSLQIEEKQYSEKEKQYAALAADLEITELATEQLLQELREEKQRLNIKTQRLNDERLELLSNISFASIDFPRGSEEFIHARAREFAESRNADEIALKLVKDLVPVAPNEYIKQNFEGNTVTRQFEKSYKASAHRLARLKNWGVHFVQGEGEKSKLIRLLNTAVEAFRNLIRFKANPEKIVEWQKLAEHSAAEYLDVDAQLAPLEDAKILSFDKKNKRDAFFKLAAYVSPAIFPWLTGNISSYSYLKKIIAKAKESAKDYEAEDMQKAVETGKYKSFLDPVRSKKALDFIIQANEVVTLQCHTLFN